MANSILYYRNSSQQSWHSWTVIWYDSQRSAAGEIQAESYFHAAVPDHDKERFDFCIGVVDCQSNTDLGVCEIPGPDYPAGTNVSEKIIWFRPAGANSAILTRPPFPAPIVVSEKDKTQGQKMINVGIKREAGKLMLVVDAKEFHEELDKIGCVHSGGMYINRPASNIAVASSRFEMSTECLLKREYPAKFDLSGIWSSIPTSGQLNQLCESAYAAGRKILDHYQPIDICITIQKKIIK